VVVKNNVLLAAEAYLLTIGGLIEERESLGEETIELCNLFDFVEMLIGCCQSSYGLTDLEMQPILEKLSALAPSLEDGQVFDLTRLQQYLTPAVSLGLHNALGGMDGGEADFRGHLTRAMQNWILESIALGDDGPGGAVVVFPDEVVWDGRIEDPITFPSGTTSGQAWQLMANAYRKPKVVLSYVSALDAVAELGNLATVPVRVVLTKTKLNIQSAVFKGGTSNSILVITGGTQTIIVDATTSGVSTNYYVDITDAQSSVRSGNLARTFQARAYFGFSALTMLNAGQVTALAQSRLGGSVSDKGSYQIRGTQPGYMWICYPDAWGDLAELVGIKNASNNSIIPMADASDDAGFNLTANGFSYKLLSVGNAFSVSVPLRLMRSKNLLVNPIDVILTPE
jgi:hypothetical protein